MKKLSMDDLKMVAGGELSEDRRSMLVDLVISAKYSEGWSRDQVLTMTRQMTGNDQESIDFVEFLWDENIV